MAGNSYGQLFKITTFGESHGQALGVVIDGCPAGLNINLAFIQNENVFNTLEIREEALKFGYKSIGKEIADIYSNY